MAHTQPAALSLRVSPDRYPGLLTAIASLGFAVSLDAEAADRQPALVDDPATCRELRQRHGHLAALLGLTHADDPAGAAALTAAGADDLLAWPASTTVLQLRLANLWDARCWRSHGTRLGGLLPSLAHDVRLPLFSVRGYAGLLQEGSLGPVTPQQSEAAGIMIGAIARIQRLLDDVQALAHLEAGVLVLDAQPILLQTVAARAVGLMSGFAAAAKVVVALSVTGEARVVRGDEGRLERAVSNLLTNAIGHSSPGGQVALAVSYGAATARCSVTDAGPGLAAEDQGGIFQRYYRTRSGSIVLGLSIARELIELHGGHIWVESEPGAGATFTFELPYAPDADATQASASGLAPSPAPSG